jgi:hypothetical protein
MTFPLRARGLAALTACFLLSACFEEPVRDRLHLHLAAGAVVVVWTHEVDAPDRAQGNPALARRMEASRDALARSLTPASGWFERTTAAAERVTLERVDGLARRGRWSAVLTDPLELENLLHEIGLTAFVGPAAGGVELSLEPAALPHASRAQRGHMDELIGAWSLKVARYLGAAAALYDYLDVHPERAPACFAHLFEGGDSLADVPLDSSETTLVAELGHRADDVAAVLLTGNREAFSPNELSRLVFDPFPARLTISSAAGFVASEGLLVSPAGLERAPISLWQALIGLEGFWISPDVVTAMVAPVPDDEQPEVDPVAFAAVPRRHGALPSAADVEDELRARLARVEVMRVTWPGPAPAPDIASDPQQLLDAGEAAVPR